MEEERELWTAVILNKVRNHDERWRILCGEGMGYCHESKDNPVCLFRIAKGMKRKTYTKTYFYANEMSLLYFFQEAEAPLLVRKNARDWLVANGYTEWLKSKSLWSIDK